MSREQLVEPPYKPSGHFSKCSFDHGSVEGKRRSCLTGTLPQPSSDRNSKHVRMTSGFPEKHPRLPDMATYNGRYPRGPNPPRDHTIKPTEV